MSGFKIPSPGYDADYGDGEGGSGGSSTAFKNVSVADQTERLALTSPDDLYPGDVATQSDDNSTWILVGNDPSVAGNWRALPASLSGSSLTASDIRALGFFDTSNDGTGSGLDADTVDGQHASAFDPAGSAAAAQSAAEATAANADNLTSGTVADARIPSTITRDSELGTAAAANTGDFDPAGSAAAVASDLTDHENTTTNPHSVTKAQVGLANVDNTSDANKPVSSAQQTALDGKLDKSGGTLTGQTFYDDATNPGSVGFQSDVLFGHGVGVRINPADAAASASLLQNGVYLGPGGAIAADWAVQRIAANIAQLVAGDQLRVQQDPVHDNDLARRIFVLTEIASAIAAEPEAGFGLDTSRTGYVDVYPVDVQDFSASGTYTKPSWADSDTWVRIQAIAPGAGGDAGYKNVAGQNRPGGGGGAPGGIVDILVPATDFDTTEAVTIGAAGVGGVGVSVNGTSAAGTHGGNIVIDTIASQITITGGRAGQHGGGFVPGSAQPGGYGRGGNSVLTNQLSAAATLASLLKNAEHGGGGAGASRDSANVSNSGGLGGPTAAGLGGTQGSPGTAGADGTNGIPGSGGGGGDGDGANGGAGGFPGGGGGGGAWGTAGNSGSGGAGGGGWLRMTTFRT